MALLTHTFKRGRARGLPWDPKGAMDGDMDGAAHDCEGEGCTLLLALGETGGRAPWPFYSKFPFVPMGQRAHCARRVWGQPPWHFGVAGERALRQRRGWRPRHHCALLYSHGRPLSAMPAEAPTAGAGIEDIPLGCPPRGFSMPKPLVLAYSCLLSPPCAPPVSLHPRARNGGLGLGETQAQRAGGAGAVP